MLRRFRPNPVTSFVVISCLSIWIGALWPSKSFWLDCYCRLPVATEREICTILFNGNAVPYYVRSRARKLIFWLDENGNHLKAMKILNGLLDWEIKEYGSRAEPVGECLMLYNSVDQSGTIPGDTWIHLCQHANEQLSRQVAPEVNSTKTRKTWGVQMEFARGYSNHKCWTQANQNLALAADNVERTNGLDSIGSFDIRYLVAKNLYESGNKPGALDMIRNINLRKNMQSVRQKLTPEARKLLESDVAALEKSINSN